VACADLVADDAFVDACHAHAHAHAGRDQRVDVASHDLGRAVLGQGSAHAAMFRAERARQTRRCRYSRRPPRYWEAIPRQWVRAVSPDQALRQSDGAAVVLHAGAGGLGGTGSGRGWCSEEIIVAGYSIGELAGMGLRWRVHGR